MGVYQTNKTQFTKVEIIYCMQGYSHQYQFVLVSRQPGVRDDVIEVRKTTSLFTPPDLMDFVSKCYKCEKQNRFEIIQ